MIVAEGICESKGTERRERGDGLLLKVLEDLGESRRTGERFARHAREDAFVCAGQTRALDRDLIIQKALYNLPPLVMEDSLVGRRSRRSTAGNRHVQFLVFLGLFLTGDMQHGSRACRDEYRRSHAGRRRRRGLRLERHVFSVRLLALTLTCGLLVDEEDMFESDFASTDEGQGDEEAGEKALQEEAKRAKRVRASLPFHSGQHGTLIAPGRPPQTVQDSQSAGAQSDVWLSCARGRRCNASIGQGESEAAAPRVAGPGGRCGDG